MLIFCSKNPNVNRRTPRFAEGTSMMLTLMLAYKIMSSLRHPVGTIFSQTNATTFLFCGKALVGSLPPFPSGTCGTLLGHR